MIDPEGHPRNQGAVSLLIGTANPAKADRLRTIVAGWPFEIHLPTDLREPDRSSPPEPGASHLEIATNKALAWSERTGFIAIASDGGLTVPALGDAWDSLTTKRSAGEDADDDHRLQRLIALMEPHAGESRKASWTEAVALARGSTVINTWQVEGREGYLSRTPASARIEGFWAASIWFFPQFERAYTELSPEQLETIDDPWVRLTNDIQSWLRTGGWDLATTAIQ